MTTTSHPAAHPPYRWIFLIASALILAVSMGSIVNGLSAYLVPLGEANGWPRGAVALINFCGIMGMALGGPVMGPLADRRGTRPVVTFGVVVLGLTYLAAGQMRELWQFYVLFFAGGFLGAAAIFSPVMSAVGTWFTVGAGFAIGIASAGQALGQGGVPFASTALIGRLGTDGAFVANGIAILALVPLAMLLRAPPPVDSGSRATIAAEEAGLPPTRRVVTVLSVAIILCCTCMSVPLMHLVPLVQDKGFSPEQAGGVIFLVLLTAIAGRVAFGRFADMVGALPAYMTATAWMTVMIFGFTQLDSLPALTVYALVYGFGYGGVMTGVLVSIRMLTPAARRGAAMGTVTMFGWFGHAIGGYIGGALYDLTGGHVAAYGVAAICGVLNLIVVGSFYRQTRRPQRAFA